MPPCGRVARSEGRINVETRTDLQRLIAHARILIDLAPGAVIARECIESLRLGTPILVPVGSAAEVHARVGGMSFSDIPDCLAGVRRLMADDVLRSVSAAGRGYADATFGRSDNAVSGLREFLSRGALGRFSTRARSCPHQRLASNRSFMRTGLSGATPAERPRGQATGSDCRRGRSRPIDSIVDSSIECPGRSGWRSPRQVSNLPGAHGG